MATVLSLGRCLRSIDQKPHRLAYLAYTQITLCLYTIFILFMFALFVLSLDRRREFPINRLPMIDGSRPRHATRSADRSCGPQLRWIVDEATQRVDLFPIDSTRRDATRLASHACLYVCDPYVIFAILIIIMRWRSSSRRSNNKQTKTTTRQRHENYYTLKMGSHFQLRFARIANALNKADLVNCRCFKCMVD